MVKIFRNVHLVLVYGMDSEETPKQQFWVGEETLPLGAYWTFGSFPFVTMTWNPVGI